MRPIRFRAFEKDAKGNMSAAGQEPDAGAAGAAGAAGVPRPPRAYQLNGFRGFRQRGNHYTELEERERRRLISARGAPRAAG